MLRSRTFGYVTAALPGLEAFLLIERIRMMAGEAALHDRYLVIDAPATGTALELLSVAAGIKGLAPVGTLNRLADGVQAFLTDPNRFSVVIVVTPEELALREGIDTANTLRGDMGIEVAGAVVNRATEAMFDEGELQNLRAQQTHRNLAERRVAESRATASARSVLERKGLAAFDLPMLYRPVIGTSEIALLARKLAAGLVAK
jgi:anion-transporting  ArsA/GET3 family ATPase